jgi:D-arabinose 1-dehydrogenase-like Zn-dependent alcohol dehydrogenase
MLVCTGFAAGSATAPWGRIHSTAGTSAHRTFKLKFCSAAFVTLTFISRVTSGASRPTHAFRATKSSAASRKSIQKSSISSLTVVQVGAPEHPLSGAVFPLILKRRHFTGSAIGGIAETEEMLTFCAERKISADIELIPIQKINEAYERMLKSDVKYRFCIDMASLKSAA